jgi:hypothetical protein
LSVKALSGPVVTDLSLRFTIDGRVTDLGSGAGVRRLVPCDACAANGIEVSLSAETLRALARAKRIEARVLGVDVELSAEERAGLRRFASEIGIEAR